jgi:hypothetical protein
MVVILLSIDDKSPPWKTFWLVNADRVETIREAVAEEGEAV